MVVRRRGGTYTRDERENETRVTNNERGFANIAPTFAQRRRTCACARERPRKGLVREKRGKERA